MKSVRKRLACMAASGAASAWSVSCRMAAGTSRSLSPCCTRAVSARMVLDGADDRRRLRLCRATGDVVVMDTPAQGATSRQDTIAGSSGSHLAIFQLPDRAMLQAPSPLTMPANVLLSFQ